MMWCAGSVVVRGTNEVIWSVSLQSGPRARSLPLSGSRTPASNRIAPRSRWAFREPSQQPAPSLWTAARRDQRDQRMTEVAPSVVRPPL
ncbi:hypothetical protein ACOMHN_030761 [Nucella lapillus]